LPDLKAINTVNYQLYLNRLLVYVEEFSKLINLIKKSKRFANPKKTTCYRLKKYTIYAFQGQNALNPSDFIN